MFSNTGQFRYKYHIGFWATRYNI